MIYYRIPKINLDGQFDDTGTNSPKPHDYTSKMKNATELLKHQKNYQQQKSEL